MSKRVSNKRGRARKTLARSQVQYGWRKTLARQKAILNKTGEEDA